VADKKTSGVVAQQEKNVLIACESKDKKSRFIVTAVVDSICQKAFKQGQKFHSDALPALNIID
jgi:hypothetical protein